MKGPDDSATSDARSYNPLLVALVALALALRLPGFNESLWYDELWSTRVVLSSVEALMRVIATDPHPPFYSVVMFIWIRIFGDSEISVRMLPLICGLLTIVLTARLAAAYGGARAAPVAALILAIAPTHIWYSQEARQYSLLLLLLTSCTWAFHKIRQSHARRWYAAYAILALCLVLTHYFAIAYVFAFTLLALPDRRARTRMLSIVGAIACVLATYLAVRWRFAALQAQLGYLRVFGIAELWKLMFEWYLTGGALGRPENRVLPVQLGVLAVQLVLLALVVRGLNRAEVAPVPTASPEPRWDRLARRWELTLLLMVLPVALLTLGLLGAKRIYIERSAISGLPFFAIALGIGATSFRSARWRALSVGLIAGFGIVVLANYYAKADRATVGLAHPDWRAAAQWIRRQKSASQRPAVVVSIRPAVELLYYDSGFGVAERGQLGGASAPPVDEREARSIRGRLKRRFPITVDSLRGTRGRIYHLPAPDVSRIKSILDREEASEFFVVTNRFITETDRLRDAIAADQSFNVEAVFEPRGLRLLRVREIAAAPQPEPFTNSRSEPSG